MFQRRKRRVRLGFFAVLALAVAMLAPAIPAGADEPLGAAGPQQREDIFIDKNREFDPAHGVVSGSGTASDPYVISGWNLRTVYIKDTSKHVKIVNNNIAGELVLDWIGDGVTVRNNHIGDLRVNQNVPRKGDMTSGLISDNEIGVVGQLRHWDGVFENNVVGTQENMLQFPGFQAMNFDGFNGGRVQNNTFYGYVDSTLHGHHHSSSFDEEVISHYHGKEEAHHDMAGMMVDHSQRYHRVYIRNNTIHSTNYFALRYNDIGHQANDRTAASETNKELNKPHMHYTKVFMTGNKLVGSGLMVDVFNAKDKEVHLGTATGAVLIKDNNITLARDTFQFFSRLVGIGVFAAEDVMVDIVGNKVTGVRNDEAMPGQEWLEQPSVGIQLQQIDKANLSLINNTLTQHGVGVEASFFTKSVDWVIKGLKTSAVDQPIYYDGNNVPNPPEEQP
ncbi:MAG TPA: hypothetical protein VNC78_10715 [Actinomycetota bacterium]|nr:hypothetical protein [Actinomycetota bacterium]